jgi:pilus assembly protein TadC
MTASEVLVVFLSVALAVFLALGIILVIYLIIIAKKINQVADSAKRTVDRVEGIASMASKAFAPAMISNFFFDTIAKFTKGRKHKKGDE